MIQLLTSDKVCRILEVGSGRTARVSRLLAEKGHHMTCMDPELQIDSSTEDSDEKKQEAAYTRLRHKCLPTERCRQEDTAMNQSLWIFVIVVSAISLIGSAFVVIHYYRLVKSREDHTGMPREEKNTGKKWGYFLLWSLFYCAIGVIMMVQYERGMADREMGDILFVLVPVVFMVIGSAMGRKAAKRRRFATAVTTAVVVDKEPRGSSQNRTYAPIYEFYAEGAKHRITSESSTNSSFGRGFLSVSVGEEVELHYIPGRPDKIYVPKEQRGTWFFVWIFRFIGVGFPVIALAGPFLRNWMK